MKRKKMIAVVTVLVLALASFGYAKYVSGFKVVEVSGDQVTVQKGEENPIVVTGKSSGYKVGDEVQYDAEKQRLKAAKSKKPLEGC